MKTVRILIVLALCSIISTASAADRVSRMIDRLGTDRGICVILGEEVDDIARQIIRNTDMLLYVQAESEESIRAARDACDEAGLYGTRVFIHQGSLSKLKLADNVADVVIVARNTENVSESEAKRIVRPGGRILRGPQTWTKPLLDGADDWSHPYHGPDNNPQSDDTVIKGPYLTQFLAEPRYAPLPQVAVASAGRVFKAFGHVAFKKREEAFLNKLVAFNGYNGTILWQRDLTEGVMIHRNTLIATPEKLYIADDKSCKVIDTATGETIDEIIPEETIAGGTFWKWMAMQDGVLYAMTGVDEQSDPTKKWERNLHGWPWNPVSEGFNQPNQPWGYGKNLMAIDPESKKILWHHHEETPIDGRAICMTGERIYAFGFGKFLSCVNAKTGKVLWRKTPANAPKTFEALGQYSPRQDWRTNWRTAAYLKCSDKALYFAGPQVDKLLALSAEDGSVLWENAYNNFQIVLRDDGLYAISGQIDKHPSKVFDALTGEELASIDKERRACTRPTGSSDAVFFRASGGSTRLDTATKKPQWISPMRPNCHDGVTIANGLLYWWPSVCDCQLTLYGITSLAPAGDFDFYNPTEADRLISYTDNPKEIAAFDSSEKDWTAFRADATASASTTAILSSDPEVLWHIEATNKLAAATPLPPAPIAVGDTTFVAGSDGVVRAFKTATGEQIWKTYTAGGIRVSPTFAGGRLYVGSGDGYAYCLEAKTGRTLWRFRAAPKDRIIPVYGSLTSTWPAAAGVLVDNGTAYVAAGIVNFDGTYVYALDAVTGKVKWQNATSGHLDRFAKSGVSVQGHLLLHGGKLYLAGGTSVSPAVYDAKTGECLNDPAPLAGTHSASPRGWELTLLGDYVAAVGRPFYAHPDLGVYDATVFNRVFLASKHDSKIAWVTNEGSGKVMCYTGLDDKTVNSKVSNPGARFNLDWKKMAGDLKASWSFDCKGATAVAFADNAAVIAVGNQIVAVRLQDGSVLWKKSIPAAVTPWGLAIDRNGTTLVVLEDGGIMSIGDGRKLAAR